MDLKTAKADLGPWLDVTSPLRLFAGTSQSNEHAEKHELSVNKQAVYNHAPFFHKFCI